MSSDGRLDRSTDEESTTETPATPDVSADAVDDEEDDDVEVVHAPPRFTQIAAVGAAALGTILTAPFTTLAIPFGFAGLAIVAITLFVTHSTGWLTAGSGLVLVGALISGAFGVLGPELMLIAVGVTIIGWDAGQHAIVVGEQLGRQTRSYRNQLVHVTATTLVVGGVSTFVYVVYLFGSGGRPGPAVATVVLGILVTVWLYRT